MITEQHIEEELSRVHVRAMAAYAGLNLSKPELDYGIDGILHEVKRRRDGRRIQTDKCLDFQLKASTRWRQEGTKIVYALEVKTFNDLVDRHAECVRPSTTRGTRILENFHPKSETHQE